MRAPGIARAALVVLALEAVSVGLPAAFAPRGFYDDYPFFANWVDLLPPYNQHLVTDVGGLYLGFAVVLGWAAWKLQTDLVRAVGTGWALMSLLHFVFHASHLDNFSTVDAIAELIGLAFVLVLPAFAIWGVGARKQPAVASG
ncbi:hypothetical protein [Conexibacter sp. CPCC 206217]|uniref:hypothetical protein n=1 Tax=Conexibacter sp. CPCC 206217 TaxID=3064574 RepID=UPI0027245F50|nr:hypothetical protein [Conexibacter sp. CPCC 206217]MDO8214090.1 hypothetical protein [Conexibacter sp. CPCC 206217]